MEKNIVVTLLFTGWEMGKDSPQRDQDLQTVLTDFVRAKTHGARICSIPSGQEDALHLRVEANSTGDLRTLLAVSLDAPEELELALRKIESDYDSSINGIELCSMLNQMFPGVEVAVAQRRELALSHAPKGGG